MVQQLQWILVSHSIRRNCNLWWCLFRWRCDRCVVAFCNRSDDCTGRPWGRLHTHVVSMLLWLLGRRCLRRRPRSRLRKVYGMLITYAVRGRTKPYVPGVAQSTLVYCISNVNKGTERINEQTGPSDSKDEYKVKTSQDAHAKQVHRRWSTYGCTVLHMLIAFAMYDVRHRFWSLMIWSVAVASIELLLLVAGLHAFTLSHSSLMLFIALILFLLLI